MANVTLVPIVSFTNGDFSSGLDGWVALNQRVKLGTDSILNVTTPADPTPAPDGGLEAAALLSQSYSTLVQNGRAVMTSNQGGVQNTPAGSGGIVHGPVIYSKQSIFIAKDTSITFDWEASGGSDAFDVFGYIVDPASQASQIILNATGKDASTVQPVTAVKFTAAASGNFHFVFVSGTWDATKLQATGARLSIDNVAMSPIGLTNGGDGIGDTISVTFNFDQSVYGLTSGTNSTILLVNGIPVEAHWSGVDGSTTRVLSYTVVQGVSGQATIDEAALKSALEQANIGFSYTGSIPEIDTGAATLPFIDGIRPTVALASDKGVLGEGVSATITFTLSEPSSDFSLSDVQAEGGSLSGFSGSGASYTAIFTRDPNRNTAALIRVEDGKFSDAAGNMNSDASDPDNLITIAVSDVVPTIALSKTPTSLRSGESAIVTFSLSEPSVDFTQSDIEVSGGTLSDFSGTDGSYSVKVTPLANSTANCLVSVGSAAFSNLAGNKNNDGSDADNAVSFAVDTVHPEIKITSSKNVLRAGESATVAFSLSENATDFDLSDIMFSGGSLSNFGGSGKEYSASFTPLPAESGLGKISVASARFSDPNGNSNIDGGDLNNVVAMNIDTFTPRVSIGIDKASLKVGEVARLSFSLSEPSTDFTALDVAVSGGSLSNFSGSGTSYTALYKQSSSVSEGLVSVGNAKFSDLLGQSNADGAEADNALRPAALRLVGTSTNDTAQALVCGANGDRYVAGQTFGNLGGVSNAGNGDIFVSRLDSEGNPVWTRLFGTRVIERAFSLAASPDGSILLAATSQGSLNGAGASGGEDAFVVKLSEDGDEVWTNREGTRTTDRGYGVAVDASGGVYLVGQTLGQFDGQRSNGRFDGFITKYLADGEKSWTRMLGSAGNDLAKAVAVDPTGFIYVTGTAGGVLFGQPHLGSGDTFVAKYTQGGELVWNRNLGTPGADAGEGVAVAQDGSVFITGYVTGALPNATRAGLEDAFLAKFSADGVLAWVKQFGSVNKDRGMELTLGTDGAIYVAGFSSGSVGGQPGLGSSDAFVAKFQANDGTRSWIRFYGSTGIDQAEAICTDQEGRIHLAGFSDASVLDGRVNNGGNDAFVVSIDEQVPIINAISLSGVDSKKAPKTGPLLAGDQILVSLSLSEPIFVSGAPRVVLDVGGTPREAVYESGSGSASIAFYYTVTVDDKDGVGGVTVPANALVLSGGALKDSGSNNLSATTTVLPGSNNLMVNTVDLGVGFGALLHPVMVNKKLYFHWDRSGDGIANPADQLNHDALDAIFRYDIRGNLDSDSNADNLFRYTTINGLMLALPSYGGPTAGNNATLFGAQADGGSYEDLLAIWDGLNNGGGNAVPRDWPTDSTYRWSATPTDLGHAVVNLASGNVENRGDLDMAYVALELLRTTPLSAVSRTALATPDPDLFTFAGGSYVARITNGFAAGDRLVFPAGYSEIRVEANSSPADGVLNLVAYDPQLQAQIYVSLTGISPSVDGSVTDLASFRTVLGAFAI